MAAEQGHACAQFNLGECFKYGIGVEEDLDEAEEWFHKASVQGDTLAIEYLYE